VKKQVILVFLLSFFFVVPSLFAENSESPFENAFTHHVDFLNISPSDDGVKVYDIGYSFTVLRVFNRVDLLGFGLGADTYKNQYGDFAGMMYVQTPLFRIHLTDMDESDDGVVLSFGADLLYDFFLKNPNVKVGFSVSWE